MHASTRFVPLRHATDDRTGELPTGELTASAQFTSHRAPIDLQVARFIETAPLLIAPAMHELRAAQRSSSSDPAAVKSDNTLLTTFDTKLASHLRAAFQQKFPGAAFAIEDGCSSSGARESLLLIDPLDGTRPFANRISTSTIIVGLVDQPSRLLKAVAIADPAQQRIMIASSHGGAQCHYFEAGTATAQSVTTLSVCRDSLTDQSTILIDVAKSFRRDGREILNTTEVEALHERTRRENHLLMLGSNGMHHLSMCAGGERLVGGYTTAVGGPWDVCGVGLILASGGAARAFTTQGRAERLMEVNPLAVLDYDILVFGNSQATVDALTRRLHSAVGYP